MKKHISKATETEWFGLLIVVIIGIVVMGLLKPNFLSVLNIRVLLMAMAINMLIASSQMIIIAIGQMNLAVGAIGGLAAISFAGAMDVWGLPAPLAALLGVSIGLFAGLLNGYLIGKTGISAFVITLATLSVFKGTNLGITRAQPFYGVAESVKNFGASTVLEAIPLLFLPTVLITVGLWMFFNRMRVGRHILAVGGNAHSAELAGVSTFQTVMWAHAVSGTLAAIAGLMVVSRLQVGHPTIGDDWLLLSFAAPVIGGSVLAGGHISVAGTFLGVIIVAMITQALVLFEIDPFIVQIVLGTLILWAVGINRWREVRQQRAMGVTL